MQVSLLLFSAGFGGGGRRRRPALRQILVSWQSALRPLDAFGWLDPLGRMNVLRPGVDVLSVLVWAFVLLSLVLAKHLDLRLTANNEPITVWPAVAVCGNFLSSTTATTCSYFPSTVVETSNCRQIMRG